MAQPLNVLLLEDNPHDAELIVRELKRAGFAPVWERVENEADYLHRLEARPEIILSDFALPDFDGVRALTLLKERGLDIPFILISGTIGEETAVTAMKNGAADYLLKDRLTRLGPAVTHALAEARLQSERRSAEIALRDSAEFIREVLDSLTGSLVVLDEHGVITAVNEHWRQFAGDNGGSDSLGQNYLTTCLQSFERAGNADARVVHDGITAVLNGSQNYYSHEYRCDSPTAQYWYLMRVSPLTGSRRGAVVTHTDVTARRLAEHAVRSNEERLRQLIENGTDVISVIDATGAIRYQSPSAFRVMGYRPEELLGHKIQEYVHPDDRTKLLEAVQRSLIGEARPAPLEYRLRHQDGTWRLLQSLGKGMTDATGEKLVVANSRDITESRLLEEKFLRAQRMEAIGTLASGVAHDLNNILAPMLMVPGLLRQHLPDPHDREILAMLEQSAQRGASIIAQLLTFSRGIEGARVSVQPRHLIKEMIQIMRETFPRNLTIKETLPADLWVVIADATQLHQVLMNLCVNARDAMPEGGKLTLTASNVKLDAEAVKAQAGVEPGPFVVIEITDSGHGIPPSVISRIFDPFFTTKGIGKGTGLGLSTVLGIVKSHRGFVTVYSEPEKGSVFRVFLPAEIGEVAATVPPDLALMRRGNNELVLVVDDEAPIRETTRKVLERYGDRVTTAESGEEAIRKFIQQHGAIKLVLTDMMMPGIGGLALIRSLQVIEPAIKVVACSGLGQDEKRAELTGLGVRQVLAKPFSSTELLAALDQVFARPGPVGGSL